MNEFWSKHTVGASETSNQFNRKPQNVINIVCCVVDAAVEGDVEVNKKVMANSMWCICMQSTIKAWHRQPTIAMVEIGLKKLIISFNVNIDRVSFVHIDELTCISIRFPMNFLYRNSNQSTAKKDMRMSMTSSDWHSFRPADSFTFPSSLPEYRMNQIDGMDSEKKNKNIENKSSIHLIE